MDKRYIFLFTALLLGVSIQAQSYFIGHHSATFIDGSRADREIPVEIYYPADQTGDDVDLADGSFPILAYGHGFVMTWEAYANFWAALVPEGYILIFPRTETDFSPSHIDLGLDLAFCIQELNRLNIESDNLFSGHIGQTSALMGHSMGGGASFLAAAETSAADAIVTFAPAETNPSAISAAQGIAIPNLIFAGSSDGVTPPPDHQIPIFNACQSTCKYLITIQGGGHCLFANPNILCDLGEQVSSSGISISRTEQHETTFDYLLPWLDWHLRSKDTAGQAFIDSLFIDSRVEYTGSCDAITSVITLDPSIGSFPNPVRGVFYIQLDRKYADITVTVLNIQGRALRTFEATHTDMLQIDFVEMPTGSYILNLLLENEPYALKILKQ